MKRRATIMPPKAIDKSSEVEVASGALPLGRALAVWVTIASKVTAIERFRMFFVIVI
jgi:hypothetical protein